METFIILLGVALLIVCLREIYLKQNTLAIYARTFDAHIHDDDNNNAYKMYIYNSLRVQ